MGICLKLTSLTKLIVCLLILSGQIYATQVETIMEDVESMLRAESQHAKIQMIIKTKKWERKVRLESWSKGVDYSLIRILGPKRDRGITFLKRYQEMWQYIPKIERRIKIPTSMMMQSWMGSDFTNDDLVKDASYTDDFKAKLIETTPDTYRVELIPYDHAPVKWGKIIIDISRRYKLPVVQVFYDEFGEIVREMTMENIKKVGNRWVAHRIQVIPLTKEGHSTTMTFEMIKHNIKLSPSRFSLQALERKSR